MRIGLVIDYVVSEYAERIIRGVSLDYKEKSATVFSILKLHPGHQSVFCYLRKEKARKKLPIDYACDGSPALINELIHLLSEINVKVSYKVLKKEQR